MIKMKKFFVGLLMVTLVIGGFGCSNPSEEKKDPGIPVETLVLRPSEITNEVSLAGTVASDFDIYVSTKMMGKIQSINVKTGELVKQGDILFVLENQDLKAAVEQARRNVEIASANLENILKGARPQEIAQAEQAVNQAKIQLDVAKTNYERFEKLYQAEAVSKQQYDQALSQYELAKAAYVSTQEKLDLLKAGATEETISSARAQVGLAQANLKAAEAKLADTIIKSPITGRVAFVKYEVGEFVMQGTPVVEVIDDQKMVVNLNVSEEVVNKVKLKDHITVMVPALGNHEFNGEIVEISPASDKQTKSYPIKIRIKDHNGMIKPGMAANLKIKLAQKSNVITVPINALVEEYGDRYVFVVEKDRVKKLKVKVGINDGKNAEITSGLKEGDEIVIKGQELLRNGDLIQKGGKTS